MNQLNKQELEEKMVPAEDTDLVEIVIGSVTYPLLGVEIENGKVILQA